MHGTASFQIDWQCGASFFLLSSRISSPQYLIFLKTSLLPCAGWPKIKFRLVRSQLKSFLHFKIIVSLATEKAQMTLHSIVSIILGKLDKCCMDLLFTIHRECSSALRESHDESIRSKSFPFFASEFLNDK